MLIIKVAIYELVVLVVDVVLVIEAVMPQINWW